MRERREEETTGAVDEVLHLNLGTQKMWEKYIYINCLFLCVLFFIITYLASLSGCIMEMK